MRAALLTPPSLAVDDVVGPFRVKEFLGEGGFGTLFRCAWDRRINRDE